MTEDGSRTYEQAVRHGAYDLHLGNLFGKHDNVRSYWEDQLTRIVLRPYLSELVLAKKRAGHKLRIVDLGCGAGQGYEILTHINKHELDLRLQHDHVLSEKDIELYHGVDLSKAMVSKGNEMYASKSHVRFQRGDLREGLGRLKEEPAYDIYFSSYGSFSHLTRAELANLIGEICEHGRDGSLVVLDVLGRYSIEWPEYWSAETEDEKVRDYSMSYLYTEFDVDQEIEHFPVRFWTGEEINELAEEISDSSRSGALELLRRFDRSIFVGRHTDTGEYNPNLKPIRRAVNSLHEDYLRTDLSQLILDPGMIPSHPEVSPFLNRLLESWNILVSFCESRLKQNVSLIEMRGWSEFSTPLQFALMTIDRVINDTGWIWYGEPRANIIEPQLGYALRSLESDMQQGVGCGHGLLAVLRVRK